MKLEETSDPWTRIISGQEFAGGFGAKPRMIFNRLPFRGFREAKPRGSNVQKTNQGISGMQVLR